MGGVTAEGYKKAAEVLRDSRKQAAIIDSVVPVVAAIDAVNNALNIGSKRHAIARRQAQLVEEQLAFNQLAWPCEEGSIQEAEAAQPWKLNYDLVTGKAAVAIKAEFGKQRQKLKKGYTRYNQAAMQSQLQKLCLAEQIAISESKNVAWRTEQAKYDATQDKNWNRRVEIAALGKNLPSQISNFYSSASSGMAGAAQAAGNAFNNALGAFSSGIARYAGSSPYVSGEFLNRPEQQTVSQSFSSEPFAGASSYLASTGTGLTQSSVGIQAQSFAPNIDSVGDPAITEATNYSIVPARNQSQDGVGNTVFHSNIQLTPNTTILKVGPKTFTDSRGDKVTVEFGQSDIDYRNATALGYGSPTNPAGY